MPKKQTREDELQKELDELNAEETFLIEDNPEIKNAEDIDRSKTDKVESEEEIDSSDLDELWNDSDIRDTYCDIDDLANDLASLSRKDFYKTIRCARLLRKYKKISKED